MRRFRIALAALLVLCIPLAASAAPKRPPLAGADPVTGKRVDIATDAGRPIVVNIWASWCPGCSQEARGLAAFARAHPEARLIGIDTQDSVGGARKFYAKYGLRHPSVFDPSGKRDRLGAARPADHLLHRP